jgi:hypothetical protein
MQLINFLCIYFYTSFLKDVTAQNPAEYQTPLLKRPEHLTTSDLTVLSRRGILSSSFDLALKSLNIRGCPSQRQQMGSYLNIKEDEMSE